MHLGISPGKSGKACLQALDKGYAKKDYGKRLFVKVFHPLISRLGLKWPETLHEKS